ncbi:unnamed protein product [Symbiodinium sp. CCMP2456]|nr:unnamed protein product [Symbiodinium sp. CCMP2456]
MSKPIDPTSGPPAGDAANENADRETFLSRRTWGLPHYLWIALAVTFALVFIPRGARKALESNTNKAEDWLPAAYAESADLTWFRDHFVHESFVLISWDGCTLGNPEKLRLLAEKLRAETDKKGGWRWYPRVGADGESLGDESRVTCLLAYLDDQLTSSNLQMRRAVERVRDIAHKECGVPLDNIHMGGPPVDNITIDIEGERTLFRLAGLAGLVGISLAYLCFRSKKLTAMVFWTAGASAGMGLSLVYWFGGVEMFVMGLSQPRLGTADAILMSMPAVVYVLALSGAIHFVNYYKDERIEHGQYGAVERAVRISWGPCLLAAFTTAIGLGSLAASDILPIQKFGIFTAIGVVVAVALLYGIMPVFLHRFPPSRRVVEDRTGHKDRGPAWHTPLARFVTRRYALTSILCLAAMGLLALGLPKIRTSVQLLNLLDEDCRLIHDYAWLEENLGNLVPMEVIVALDDNQLRSPDEKAVDLEADGKDARYRMTMFERAELARKLQAQVESLDEVSRALSAATFGAQARDDGGSASTRRAIEFTTSQALEESRGDLNEYLLAETIDGKTTGRELWRISARVTALGDVDYGRFVQNLRDAESEGGKPLDTARVCLLTAANDPENPRLPKPGTPESRLAELLQKSAIGSFTVYPLESYKAIDEAKQAQLREQLAQRFDAVVSLDPALAKELEGVAVTTLDAEAAVAEAIPAAEATAVYTGVVPLVYKTQRELLTSLKDSILSATVLIAIVMMFVLRGVAAGIASMLPNVFPIVVVFGALGWLGIKVDIGIMMAASVALGVAVDDTLHFLTWFGRGVREGLDRRTAVEQAFDRCATAMLQTTLIGGMGLAVFAVSTFTPTQQFGSLMITILAIALVGDLIMLPALLCGPLGWFFAPKAPATPGVFPHDEGSSITPTPKPVKPVYVPETPPQALAETPAPQRTAPKTASEPLTPANAALRSKLQKFRRSQAGDSAN